MATSTTTKLKPLSNYFDGYGGNLSKAWINYICTIEETTYCKYYLSKEKVFHPKREVIEYVFTELFYDMYEQLLIKNGDKLSDYDYLNYKVVIVDNGAEPEHDLCKVINVKNNHIYAMYAMTVPPNLRHSLEEKVWLSDPVNIITQLMNLDSLTTLKSIM